ncbi:tryptophan synthase subunit alpha [Marichromatium gracile]|uniref:Tryptophan synthase alpha chain n=1 Tax=Marichromatium gracile TaxID=1048 RepID=A0A4R4A5B3_MARGR|nr:tryptophan synthase subunit alpha [Marichromatium gracile]MBK1710232.1 tryptophan synthase subunit alpha [Marichromatium gracile]TCW33375.1 tryptophan synthase alpha chain [Marichromatium gracile]
MSRISTRFEQLRAAHRTALIPFITAGDPRPETTVELMHAMVAAGADLIELGVPFSDPIADGPVIQRATERALARGVSLSDVLEMVRQFRERDADTPVVAMGYLNPIEVMGYGRFARAAAAAGLDGALIVDVPPEEGHELVQVLRTESVDLVYLLAPTSTERRISRIGEVASGFVYYVSVKGVTGAANLDVDEVAAKVETIRARIPLPVGVGFGIKDGETAARVAAVADAVIVGSAIVKQIEALAETPEAIAPTIGDFIAELRGAIDAADAAANRPEQVTS